MTWTGGKKMKVGTDISTYDSCKLLVPDRFALDSCCHYGSTYPPVVSASCPLLTGGQDDQIFLHIFEEKMCRNFAPQIFQNIHLSSYPCKIQKKSYSRLEIFTYWTSDKGSHRNSFHGLKIASKQCYRSGSSLVCYIS